MLLCVMIPRLTYFLKCFCLKFRVYRGLIKDKAMTAKRRLWKIIWVRAESIL